MTITEMASSLYLQGVGRRQQGARRGSARQVLFARLHRIEGLGRSGLDMGKVDWDEVRELLLGSYMLIAPKRLAGRVKSEV